MAVDYTVRGPASVRSADNRSERDDERRFRVYHHGAPAQASRSPPGPLESTRGRPVWLTMPARAAPAPRRSQNVIVPLTLLFKYGRNSKSSRFAEMEPTSAGACA